MIGSRVDFDDVEQASREGRLMDLLKIIPKDHWLDINDGDPHNADTGNWSLLHYACTGDNGEAARVLIEHGVDKDGWTFDEETPMLIASRLLQYGPFEMLLRLGASPYILDFEGFGVWDDVISYSYRDTAIKFGRLLLMHNVKPNGKFGSIPDELMELKHGIDRCRLAIIALLRVKRVGNLWNWDKFLLREIAYSVWATRSENWIN